MATIPEVRARLMAIADDVTQLGYPGVAERIRECAMDTFRRKPSRVAPRRNGRLSDEERERICELAASTDLSQVEIASIVGTNPGRASEVLSGFRR